MPTGIEFLRVNSRWHTFPWLVVEIEAREKINRVLIRLTHSFTTQGVQSYEVGKTGSERKKKGKGKGAE